MSNLTITARPAQLSPMPFGVKSHRDSALIEAHGAIAVSPMPFGVKSHRDLTLLPRRPGCPGCHQCLSA